LLTQKTLTEQTSQNKKKRLFQPWIKKKEFYDIITFI